MQLVPVIGINWIQWKKLNAYDIIITKSSDGVEERCTPYLTISSQERTRPSLNPGPLCAKVDADPLSQLAQAYFFSWINFKTNLAGANKLSSPEIYLSFDFYFFMTLQF